MLVKSDTELYEMLKYYGIKKSFFKCYSRDPTYYPSARYGVQLLARDFGSVPTECVEDCRYFMQIFKISRYVIADRCGVAAPNVINVLNNKQLDNVGKYRSRVVKEINDYKNEFINFAKHF